MIYFILGKGPFWLNAAWNEKKKAFLYLNNTSRIKNFTNVIDTKYIDSKSVSKPSEGNPVVVYGKYKQEGNYTLKVFSPTMKAFTVCKSYPLVTTGIETLNLVLDPEKSIERTNKVEEAKKKYHQDFDQIDISKSYNKLFELFCRKRYH